MAKGEDELNVQGPGGLGLSFKGQQLFSVILVGLLGAIFAYLFFKSDIKADERSQATVAAIRAMTESNIKAEGTQRAMMYVLSLSQVERERLNLLKPKELMEMQR